jgi:tetratricopeptide (TPR) repeat protein
LPATLQALIETGPILIDVMVSGASLLARFEHLLPDGRAWRARAEEALRHRGSQALQQTDLFTQYTRVLQALARGHPLLILLDDLQWADTGSLGLLFHLGRRLAGSRILVLGAYRPEEVALGRDGEQHPLEPVVNEFQRIWGDIRIDLAEGWRLVTEIIDSQPNRLGPGFREALYRHTGGQALFTVEMLRGLQERGDLLRDEAGRWVEGTSLDWAAFPNRIESVIAQQLGRLPPEWRELLATASIEGEEFTAEVVARVQGVDEREVLHTLNGALSKQYHLVNAQSTRLMGPQRLSRYRFRHHLFQHYLYQGLNAVERAHLHEETGNSLEALYGTTPEFLYESARLMTEDRFGELYGSRAVEVASIVPQVAWHYDAAGLVDKAVAYLSQAAFSAARSFAPKVALPHITRGVELPQSLPFTPELARREMSFQHMLGFMRGLTMGATVESVRQAHERVCELARKAGDDVNLVWGLFGLADYYHSRGEYHTARELAEQMLALIPRAAPDLLPDAHCFLGECVWASMGDFAKARAYLDPLFWPTPGRGALRPWPKRVPVRGFDVFMTYWCTGWPDLSLRLVEMFLLLAPPGWHTFFSMACVIMHCVRREVQDVLQGVQAMLPKTTEEHAGAHSPATLFLLGWAHAHLGQPEEGVSEMRQALDIWKQRGSGVGRSSWLAGLAWGHALARQPEEGLKVIAEAFEWLESKDERICEAELHHLRGKLLLQRGDDPQPAEDCFRQAIAIAQRQGAKSWELRATTSLARLLRDQGRRDEAYEVLAAIYNWFSEGFDTPDLVDARALLDELG